MTSTTRLAKFIPYRRAGEFVDFVPGLRVRVRALKDDWRVEVEAAGPVAVALAAEIERAALQLGTRPVEPPGERA